MARRAGAHVDSRGGRGTSTNAALIRLGVDPPSSSGWFLRMSTPTTAAERQVSVHLARHLTCRAESITPEIY
jgi:hypothetical protein